MAFVRFVAVLSVLFWSLYFRSGSKCTENQAQAKSNSFRSDKIDAYNNKFPQYSRICLDDVSGAYEWQWRSLQLLGIVTGITISDVHLVKSLRYVTKLREKILSKWQVWQPEVIKIPIYWQRITTHGYVYKRKWLNNRVSYYSNSSATFNTAVMSIDRSGDVHPHPGPIARTNIDNDHGESNGRIP
ncbi:Hypothetical predicted protein, partial [Paramuricea clavata]